MTPITELQALQTAADLAGLKVHINFQQDKRKTTIKYFATKNEQAVSPSSLDYDQMNHFLLGWNNALKTLNK